MDNKHLKTITLHLYEHTGTEERIPDMAQVELQVMLYVLIGFHNCDCS